MPGSPGAPQGGAWGNPVSPPFTSAVHAAAPHNTGMNMFVPGRAAPSQTLPSRRGLGKPGFPISQPLVGAAGAPTGRAMGKPGFPYFHLSHPCGCAAQRQNENICSWEGEALPNPPRGRVVSWEGCALPNPPARGLCSPQTVMRMAHSARMKIFIVLGRAQPSQPLPAGGLVPGRGQGRGAAAPLRPNSPTGGLCSPQPFTRVMLELTIVTG